jgi:hypothetical protein
MFTGAERESHGAAVNLGQMAWIKEPLREEGGSQVRCRDPDPIEQSLLDPVIEGRVAFGLFADADLGDVDDRAHFRFDASLSEERPAWTADDERG